MKIKNDVTKQNEKVGMTRLEELLGAVIGISLDCVLTWLFLWR